MHELQMDERDFRLEERKICVRNMKGRKRYKKRVEENFPIFLVPEGNIFSIFLVPEEIVFHSSLMRPPSPSETNRFLPLEGQLMMRSRGMKLAARETTRSR